MKFKQIIKNNIKRISAVILCLIMIFSISITTYALDGEAGGLDKAILDKYIKSSTTLFNPQELPVYSPFNHETLYYLFKWPVGSTGLEASETEYVSLTYKESDLYYTYYLFPERFTEETGGFDSLFDKLLDSSFDFSDLYVKLFGDIAVVSSDGNTLNLTGKKTLGESIKDYPIHPEALQYYKGYVYSTVRSKDGLVSANAVYYGSYYDCLNKLPINNICQIYYYSTSTISVDIPEFFINETVGTKNLNYLVSVGTYSITAYDYFDSSAIDSFTSTAFPNLSYSIPNTDFGVPECIRGPNFPSDTTTLSWKSTSSNYYLQDGFFTSDRAFLMFNTAAKSSSRTETYFIVFPEEVKTPILYAKFLGYGGGQYYQSFLQLISKVDYDIYGGSRLVGHFDAETTTFRCEYNASQWSYHYQDYGAFIMYFNTGGAYDNSDSYRMIVGEEYKVYPYLNYSMGISQFRLNMHGNSVAFSIFPSNSGSLGFYTYISPDIQEDIQSGNSGVPGGSITPGGSSDFDPFWNVSFEKEYDGILGMELPEAPDFSYLLDIDFTEIWLLPEKVVQCFIDVLQWITDSFNIFIETYGGPIQKIFILCGLVLDYFPNGFKFLFILSLTCILCMKMLQFVEISAFQFNNISSRIERSRGSNKDMSRNDKQNKDKKKKRKSGDE